MSIDIIDSMSYRKLDMTVTAVHNKIIVKNNMRTKAGLFGNKEISECYDAT